MNAIAPNQLLDALRWRYATKEFDPNQAIPDDTWDTLEESLVLTPSSFGLQPWEFIVLTDRGFREQLVEHSWGQRQVVDASPRAALKRQIAKAEQAGYRMMTGVECEYFLITPDGDAISDPADTQSKPCYDQSALMRLASSYWPKPT